MAVAKGPLEGGREGGREGERGRYRHRFFIQKYGLAIYACVSHASFSPSVSRPWVRGQSEEISPFGIGTSQCTVTVVWRSHTL